MRGGWRSGAVSLGLCGGSAASVYLQAPGFVPWVLFGLGYVTATLFLLGGDQ